MKRLLQHRQRFALLVVFLVLVLVVPVALGQQPRRTKEDLEQSKKDLEEEIAFKRDLLFQTQRNRRASLGEVSLLNDLIFKRESLIATIDAEIDYLERNIRNNQQNIRLLEKEQVRLKDEYARLIYFAYRNKSSYQRLMFIFAADNFNQAYQRLKYLQYYSRYRKRQADNIRKSQESMRQELSMMEGQRQEKALLLRKQEGEKGKLAQEKTAKDRTVSRLSQQEGALRAEISEKEAAARKLQKEIDAIIAQAIAESQQNSASPSAGPGQTFTLTPVERQLSNSFNENKGRLPWPTERGHKSQSFGKQPHPDIPNVYTQNNGIDIITSSGSRARAVFAGTVTAVRSVPKYRNVVIIRHGEFLTVYTNLDRVAVSEGDKVEIKQVIGTIFTNPETSRTELHFEVRKGYTLLNPEEWLAGSL